MVVDKPTKPRFRRGIKLGRIRKAFDIIPLHSRKSFNRGKIIGVRKKFSGKYFDSKTKKELNSQEVAAFRDFKRAQFNERLSKLPRKSPQRVKRVDEDYVDRFTGEKVVGKDIVQIKRALLGAGKDPLKNPVFPKKFIKAAETAAREHKFDSKGKPTSFERNVRILYDWWLETETTIGVPPAFPREKIGSPPLDADTIFA